MNVQGISNSYVNVLGTTGKAADAGKPTWDGKKAYTYLEDMNAAGLEYGRRATSYYAAKTDADGAMSVDDLKKQIGDWFPDYTLTTSEPKNVTKGKHYLYIDERQMKKMADDPAYRAKVYGLMDRELTVGKEWTMTYSDGAKKSAHITGSVFSLSEANKKYAGADGVPYRGSCTTDSGFSSSNSHLQVRSQSFLYDNLDSAKAARKNRLNGAGKKEKTSAAKAQAERLAKKRAEKKAADRKAAAKEEKAALREKLDEALQRRRDETADFLGTRVDVGA